MEEITDEESARAWLEGKPREVQVAFAARAALRALPGIATADAATLNQIALPVLRAILTSSVATVRPTDDVKTAAGAAAQSAAAASFYADPDSAAVFSTLSALSAALSDYSAAAGAAESAAYSANVAATALSDYSAATSAAQSAAWNATSLDVARLDQPKSVDRLFVASLWPNGRWPDGLDMGFNDLRTFWGNDLDTWSFWSRWYEAMLAEADPMDWKVQEAVALIPDEIWEAGPERAAEQIREIEAEFAYTQAKIGETLALDESTLFFSAKPIRASNAQRLARHLSRVEDALSDIIALGGNNGLTEDTSEYRMIRRLVEKYKDDPERIAFDLTDVNGSIRRQITSGEYPDSEPFRLLQAANTACISTICDMEPEVARELEREYPHLAQVLEEEQIEIVEAALQLGAATQEQATRETTQEDAAEILYGAIVDAAKDGLPEGPRRVASTYRSIVLRRQISRLTQLAQEWTRVPKLAEHYETDVSKATRVVGGYTGIAGLLYAAVALLGRMLGIG